MVHLLDGKFEYCARPQSDKGKQFDQFKEFDCVDNDY